MNTPPPCTGGQIGYGDTNSTLNLAPGPWPLAPAPNPSRQPPPTALRNAPASPTRSNALALHRELIALGSASAARAIPAKLDLSGESPATQLNIADDQAKKNCAASHRQECTFFHANSTKFF